MAVTKNINGIDVLFRKAAPLEQSAYPGLNERTYVLEKGSVHREGGMPLQADVFVEQDVPVRLRDGVTIRTDIYRPVGDGPYPAIMGWSHYGKRGGWFSNDIPQHPTRMDVPVSWEDGLNKFEAPTPAYWVAHGYAVIAPDSRGSFNSEGDIHTWDQQERTDEYDVIEWVAQQSWSNGKVGLTGNSMLAISQWFAASERPPHLAAIAPWEGASDVYRDTNVRGGIPEMMFSGAVFGHLYGNNLLEDVPAMSLAHPLFDDYWAVKVAPVDLIEVPAYVVASWTNLLHTGGTFRAWSEIGSKEKWLRVHNTHEWTDYFNPKNVEDLRRFFDCYLKGLDNGWKATPKVRLSVLDPGHVDLVDRAEEDFPLARQEVRSLYLSDVNGAGVLSATPQAGESELSYDSQNRDGITFSLPVKELTELTGYFNLKLWVEARGNDDMDIFAFLRKRDAQGRIQEFPVVTERTHTGPNGRLRVSLRAKDEARSTPLQPFITYEKFEKLAPGEIVPVEIGFWPYSVRWQDGETIELVITGTDLLVRPELPQIPPIPTLNKGVHVTHFGGKYDSQLLIPFIPNP